MSINFCITIGDDLLPIDHENVDVVLSSLVSLDGVISKNDLLPFRYNSVLEDLITVHTEDGNCGRLFNSHNANSTDILVFSLKVSKFIEQNNFRLGDSSLITLRKLSNMLTTMSIIRATYPMIKLNLSWS